MCNFMVGATLMVEISLSAGKIKQFCFQTDHNLDPVTDEGQFTEAIRVPSSFLTSNKTGRGLTHTFL